MSFWPTATLFLEPATAGAALATPDVKGQSGESEGARNERPKHRRFSEFWRSHLVGRIPARLRIYESPCRLLLLIALTVFVIHFVAMAGFDTHHGLWRWLVWAVESSALVILLFPILYLFSFRPLLIASREAKQAEEQMRESEHKYRRLFECLSDAAFLIDVETGRILDTNPQAERLLGRTRREIVGMNQGQLYPPETPSAQRLPLSLADTNNQAGHYDGQVLHRGGTIIVVHISAAPLTLYGRRLVLALFRETTQNPAGEYPL